MTVFLETAITSLELAARNAALEAALQAKDLIAKNPEKDRPLMVLFEQALQRWRADHPEYGERLAVLQHMLEELRLKRPQPKPPAAPVQ